MQLLFLFSLSLSRHSSHSKSSSLLLFLWSTRLTCLCESMIANVFYLIIFFLFPSTISCQCSSNWFGENCSQINLCNYNESNLCPNDFLCQTINDQQECLATGTFEGNSSELIGRFTWNSKWNKEISFRLRAHVQTEHLLTINNRNTSQAFSLLLSNDSLIYQTSNSSVLFINQTFEQWTNIHLQWTDNSTLILNSLYTYPINEEVFMTDHPMEILLGNGFRGCLEYVLIGGNLYVPFYNESLFENDTRVNRMELERFEQIDINNCTFDHVCTNLSCEHGQCIEDFDRGKCLCYLGWEGEHCEKNIDECQRGNNCSKEHSTCEDQLNGYYTCKCQQGFTGIQ